MNPFNKVRSWSGSLIRALLRYINPETYQHMPQNGLHPSQAPQLSELACIEVYDNRAERTLFIFSGLAALFLGQPAFEFKKLFKSAQLDFNFVFVRDVTRSFYHYAPDGGSSPESSQAGQLADVHAPERVRHLHGNYYQQLISTKMEELGARHNYAMGLCSGADAAIHFGTVCGMDSILAFGPIDPVRRYTGLCNKVKAFCNLPLLCTNLRAYVESNTLLYAVAHFERVLQRRLHQAGRSRSNALHTYKNAVVKPPLTIVYGQNFADRGQAMQYEHLEGPIRFIHVAAAAHNSARYLKNKGELIPLIVDTLNIRGE